MGINGIWITWENQRRNRELSSALGLPIYELDNIDQIKNRTRKYSIGILRTLEIYLKKKPDIVFCQNPSLILVLFTILFKPFFRYRVVVDAHNAGLFPKEGHSRALLFLSGLTQRLADVVIVTNKALLAHVKRNGGRGFVLPDKIPDFPCTDKIPLKGRNNILFICSYANDEPYEIVFKAGRLLEQDICIYVTGNYSKRNIDPEKLPQNIILTGFLPEMEYVQMLNSVDATIDLTTRENCLVCGAYESVELEKPMILSKTRALMEYFNQGTVFAEHSVEDMQRCIIVVLERQKVLSEEVKELKKMRLRQWLEQKKELEKIIQEWFLIGET